MKAKYFKRISEENQMSISKLYEQLELAAKRGEMSMLLINRRFSDDTIVELAKEGFRLEQVNGIMGERNTVISWD